MSRLEEYANSSSPELLPVPVKRKSLAEYAGVEPESERSLIGDVLDFLGDRPFEKAAETVAEPVWHGIQESSASTYREAGNLVRTIGRSPMMLPPGAPPEMGGAIQLGADRAAGFLDAMAEIAGPKEELQGLMPKIVAGATRMGVEIPKMLIAGGGSAVPGAALLGGLSASPEDPLAMGVGAAQGALTIGSLHGLSALPAAAAMPTGAAIFGGMSAAGGGDVEDVAAEAVLGALMSGGGPEGRVRDVLREGKRSVVDDITNLFLGKQRPPEGPGGGGSGEPAADLKTSIGDEFYDKSDINIIIGDKNSPYLFSDIEAAMKKKFDRQVEDFGPPEGWYRHENKEPTGGVRKIEPGNEGIEASRSPEEPRPAPIGPTENILGARNPVKGKISPEKAPASKVEAAPTGSKFKIGQKVFIQLPTQRRRNKAKIVNILEDDAGNPLKVDVEYGSTIKGRPVVARATIDAEDVMLPQRTIAVREYHEAMSKVPPERRKEIKANAKKFDQLAEEHVLRFMTPEEIEQQQKDWEANVRQEGRYPSKKQNAIDAYNAVKDARRKFGELLGVENIDNPVIRGEAVGKLEKYLEEHPSEATEISEVQAGDLKLKPGDRVKMLGEWYDVEPSETPGGYRLKDGMTIDIEDPDSPASTLYGVEKVERGKGEAPKPTEPEGPKFSIEVPLTGEKVGEVKLGEKPKAPPKSESTPAGDQFLIPGTEGHKVPETKIRNVGKPQENVEGQGDVFKPEKIKTGNLPQDQLDVEAEANKPAVKPEPRGGVTGRGISVGGSIAEARKRRLEMESKPEPPTQRSLVDHFEEKLGKGERPATPRELMAWAREHKADLDEKTDNDLVYDSYEAALARKFNSEYAGKPFEEQLAAAREFEAMIPTRRRTLEASSLKNQQFSTPLPLAVGMAEAAKIRPEDRIFEPTAGTGNLIAPVDGWDRVRVNELGEVRSALMRELVGEDRTTAEDYLKLDVSEDRPTVILTNPPWGVASRSKLAKYSEKPDLAAVFFEKNMRDVAEGGRVVALMPTTIFRDRWLQDLNKKYDVRAIIASPEGAYGPGRGTSVNSVMLVVDKRPPQAGEGPIIALMRGEKAPDDVLETHDILSRAYPNATFSGVGNFEDYRRLIREVSGLDRPEGGLNGSDREPGRLPPGVSRPEQQPPAAGRPRPAAGDVGLPAGESPEEGEIRPGRAARPDVVAEGPEGGIPSEPAGTTAGEQRTVAGQVRGQGKVRSRVFADFIPSVKGSAGVKHPRQVVVTRASISAGYPDVSNTKLTEGVRKANKAGVLSDVQLDFVARGIAANVEHGHGFAHGHDVGVGKGRMVAATALDELASGRSNRILVMTNNAKNILGLIGEMNAVTGGQFPYRIVDVSKAFPNASAAKKSGATADIPKLNKTVYLCPATSYSNFHKKLLDVGFDALLADEAHLFRNIHGTNMGRDWAELHVHLKQRNARHYYFSATLGRNIEEMEYLYGLGLWNPGEFSAWVGKMKGEQEYDPAKSRTSAEQQIKTIKRESGKYPSKTASTLTTEFSPAAAEQVVRELTATGYMMSSDLWRAGVEFNAPEKKLTTEEVGKLDEMSAFFQELRAVHQKWAKIDKRLKARFGIEGGIQAMVKYHYYRLRLKRAIEEAKESLARGEQPVISLIYVRGDDLGENFDIEEMEVDRKTGLPRTLTNMLEDIKTEAWERDRDTGEEYSLGKVHDAEVAKAEMYEKAREVYGRGWSDPIQEVVDAFGEDNVANLTGRMSIGRRSQQLDEFQAGKRRVAVISRASKIGITLSDVNGSRRHMIDTDQEYSPDVFKQCLGRVDRANQKSSPRITIPHFGLPGERRFLGALAGRMASIGATAKGSAESTGTEAISGFEFTSGVNYTALDEFWRSIPDEDRAWWAISSTFRDSQGNPRSRLEKLTEDDLTRFWRGFQTVPVADAKRLAKKYDEVYKKVYDQAVESELDALEEEGVDTKPYREALATGEMSWVDIRKKHHETGEILREAKLKDDLSLYEVRARDGHTYGVLTGVVSNYGKKLQPFLHYAGGKRWKFVNFEAGDQVLSGIRIMKTKVKPLSAAFGQKGFGTEITVENMFSEMNAGEKVYLGNDWVIHQGKEGARRDKYIITGPKMKDVVHEVAGEKRLRYGLRHHPAGFYYVDTEQAVRDLVKTFTLGVKPEDDVQAMRPRGGTGMRENIAGPIFQTRTTGTGLEKTSIAEIRNLLSRKLDVPIRTGGARFGTRSEIYRRHAEDLRVKQLDDIGSTCHGVAHHIDKLYGISRQFANDPDLMQLDYDFPEKSRPAEGFAEFVRIWATGGDEVARETASGFYPHWERFLNDHPELAKVLREAQGKLTTLREQGAFDRVMGQVSMSGRPIQAPWMEKVGHLKRKWITWWTDRAYTIEWAEKEMRGLGWGEKLDPARVDPMTSPTMLMRADARTASGKGKSFVMDATFDYAGQTTGASLRDVLEPIGSREDLGKLICVGVSLRHLTKYEPEGKASGIDGLDARTIVRDLADQRIEGNFKIYGKNPTFRDVVMQLDAYSDRVFDYLADAGQISPEAKAAIKALNSIYVPMKRVFDETSPNAWASAASRKFADIGQAVKRVKGSGREIVNPLLSIIKDTAEMINTADRLRVQRAFVDLYLQTGGTSKFMVEVPAPIEATKFTIDTIKKQLAEAEIEIPEDALQQVITVYSSSPQYRGKEDILSFWHGDKRRFFQMHPDLYDALKGMDDINLPVAAQLFLAKPARMTRMMATQLSAGFQLIRNPFRDALTAAMQTESKNWLLNVGKVPAGFVRRAVPGKYKSLYTRSGVDLSHMIGNDRDALRTAMVEALASDKKAKALLIARHPIEVAKEILSFTESGPRMVEFKEQYEKGEQLYGAGSAQARVMATLAAKDVSLDFTRAGTYGGVINQITPFFNAMLQGPAKMYRSFKYNPARSFIRASALLTVPTIALWMVNKDEEWYKRLPSWRKYGCWNFRIGEHTWSLPRPFIWGTVFSSLPEAFLNRMHDNDPIALEEGLAEAADQMGLSWESWLPVTLRGPVQLAANYDFFRERPIIPDYMKGRPRAEQHYDWTEMPYVKIGELLGYSPLSIRSLDENFTAGAVGDIWKGYQAVARKGGFEDEDPQLSDYPVIGTLFQREPTYEQQARGDKAEWLRVVEKVKAARKAGDDKRADELLNHYYMTHPSAGNATGVGGQ